MKQKEKGGRSFRLEIPLKISEVEDFKPDLDIKVLTIDRKGKTNQKIVNLDKSGKGSATFTFPQNPGPLRVILGPRDADDDELKGMQTIAVDIPLQRVKGAEFRISAILISSYYWYWWHRWCRTFTISGRVLCPDGSPVPGATVCAYDVDWFWWWSSKQNVGCATTDATGSFTLSFRWCCGYWPWWWWRRRFWQLEHSLAEVILPVLQRDPGLFKITSPAAQPDLNIFENLISQSGTLAPMVNSKLKAIRDNGINIAQLDSLRERLLTHLPFSAELQQLSIWPWHPWYPWWDCTPDIIFKVTQNCTGEEKVIVNESIWDRRLNIPVNLNVTLTANDESCCIDICDDPLLCPDGNCMVIFQACNSLVTNIGGNPGAPPSPEGYLNPGVAAYFGDRPYAGNVPIYGVFGSTANVDYYEFEWSNSALGPWNPMPPAASGNFTRVYYEQVAPAGAGPEDWHSVPFSFSFIDGHNVVESRDHYEANNSPLNWGVTRFWVSNRDLLIQWLTDGNFSDGTYYLRVKGWDLSGSDLINDRVLPLCDTPDDNYIVLTLDNRPAPGPASGHPASTPDHPCGPGTVHVCTLEPDTDFLDVTIIRSDGATTAVGACGNVGVKDGDTLQVDFMAHDPDGHLAYYNLYATYGENLAVNLLGLPGATLVPLGGGPVPAAAQVGPDYGSALGQGAVSPVWDGGCVRLTVPATLAFPETCCYQLELRAYKRTIVNCDGGFSPHSNLSEYSFGVTV